MPVNMNRNFSGASGNITDHCRPNTHWLIHAALHVTHRKGTISPSKGAKSMQYLEVCSLSPVLVDRWKKSDGLMSLSPLFVCVPLTDLLLRLVKGAWKAKINGVGSYAGSLCLCFTPLGITEWSGLRIFLRFCIETDTSLSVTSFGSP